MFASLLNQSSIPVLEQVVNFAEARHSVLAGNIANLDTPGYRARDLSPEMFQARLREAISERDAGQPNSMGTTAQQPNEALTAAGKALEDLLYHDDSTGSLEKQVTAINKNQLQHNLAVAIMTSQFRLLQTAISERV